MSRAGDWHDARLTAHRGMTIIMVMARRHRFAIVFDEAVIEHLAAIERKYHSLIRREIESRLSFEPDAETRNRKPLLREVEFEAEWELRFGPDNRFRVFYAISMTRREVQVLAIGVKEGSRLSIGGEEIDL